MLELSKFGFQTLIRDYVIDNYPYGPGDMLFEEPVEERRKHSVLTAARDIGIDARRMRKHFDQAGLIAPEDRDKDNADILFDATEIAPFLKSLSPAVSALALQNDLGISRSQFALLRQDGFFPPKAAGSRAKPLWDLAAARKELGRFLEMAEQISEDETDWLDLAKAAQRLKTRPGLMLRIAEERKNAGNASGLGLAAGETGYTALCVRLADFEPFVERGETPGLTIFDFAREVG